MSLLNYNKCNNVDKLPTDIGILGCYQTPCTLKDGKPNELSIEFTIRKCFSESPNKNIKKQIIMIRILNDNHYKLSAEDTSKLSILVNVYVNKHESLVSSSRLPHVCSSLDDGVKCPLTANQTVTYRTTEFVLQKPNLSSIFNVRHLTPMSLQFNVKDANNSNIACAEMDVLLKICIFGFCWVINYWKNTRCND